ncbi:MAG: hypothetical protein ACRC92_26775 [Peptostreptococcaceae bacterium]
MSVNYIVQTIRGLDWNFSNVGVLDLDSFKQFINDNDNPYGLNIDNNANRYTVRTELESAFNVSIPDDVAHIVNFYDIYVANRMEHLSYAIASYVANNKTRVYDNYHVLQEKAKYEQIATTLNISYENAVIKHHIYDITGDCIDSLDLSANLPQSILRNPYIENYTFTLSKGIFRHMLKNITSNDKMAVITIGDLALTKISNIFNIRLS